MDRTFIWTASARLWDDSTTHGKFAMGWQLGPTIFDLMPDVLDWYYKHATPNDYFVNALSGIGYIHEANYAYMYPPEKQKQIWKEYMQLSKLYRERINLSTLTTYHDMLTKKWDILPASDSRAYLPTMAGHLLQVFIIR